MRLLAFPSCRLILVASALLLLTVPGEPADLPEDQATLKGIPAIRVIVEVLNPQAVRDGLRQDQLQHDVERRLQEAGIRITSSPEEVDWSYLYLFVNTVKHPSGLYAFNICLEFKQVVMLERNPHVRLFSTTWSADDKLGFVGAYKLREVRGAVVDKMDKFINAYLRQNPKQ
jgi:hypothetical protein